MMNHQKINKVQMEQLTMKSLVLLLMICMITAMVMAVAADNYMGGDIVVGGSGSSTLNVTDIPTAAMAPPLVNAATGSLSVTTTPAGASIFVDGVQKGVSPATVSGLAPGSHTLLLKQDGYQDLTAPVTIIAGQTQVYTAALSPGATSLSALPAATKSPGFEAVLGIAALGAVFLVKKISR
jgi:hypothetical protein